MRSRFLFFEGLFAQLDVLDETNGKMVLVIVCVWAIIKCCGTGSGAILCDF